MTTDLATRLRRLLDVIQRVHDCKRLVAEQMVADECKVVRRYIGNLATNYVRVGHRPSLRFDVAGVERLEARYALPLRYLVTYEAACARHGEAA